jgi:hypothetical protein
MPCRDLTRRWQFMISVTSHISAKINMLPNKTWFETVFWITEPSWPEQFTPNEYTSPFVVITILWPDPAITWELFFSITKMYLRMSFQEPPHYCFRLSLSSCFISLSMALFVHISNAASSGSDNAKFGAKCAGLLKNEQCSLTQERGSSVTMSVKTNHRV